MAAPTPTDPSIIAALLRERIEREPVWLPVHGPSMRPTIEPDSTVRVVAAAEPRRGEVWAFVRADSTLVIHRLRSRRGGKFTFRGDNNRSNDEPVDATLLIGRGVEVHDSTGESRALREKDRLVALARQARFRLKSLGNRNEAASR